MAKVLQLLRGGSQGKAGSLFSYRWSPGTRVSGSSKRQCRQLEPLSKRWDVTATNHTGHLEAAGARSYSKSARCSSDATMNALGEKILFPECYSSL